MPYHNSVKMMTTARKKIRAGNRPPPQMDETLRYDVCTLFIPSKLDYMYVHRSAPNTRGLTVNIRVVLRNTILLSPPGKMTIEQGGTRW